MHDEILEELLKERKALIDQLYIIEQKIKRRLPSEAEEITTWNVKVTDKECN